MTHARLLALAVLAGGATFAVNIAGALVLAWLTMVLRARKAAGT